jgi:hypothetical protein
MFTIIRHGLIIGSDDKCSNRFCAETPGLPIIYEGFRPEPQSGSVWHSSNVRA